MGEKKLVNILSASVVDITTEKGSHPNGVTICYLIK